MDDELKILFKAYNPELPSDRLFMDRLQKNLETVEMVKAELEAGRKERRLSLAVCGVVGFLFGIVSAICYPMISGVIGSFLASSNGYIMQILAEYQIFVNLAAICLCGCILSLASYDFTFTLSKARRR